MIDGILAFVIVASHNGNDRLALRPSRRPLSPTVVIAFGNNFPKHNELLLNGKPSGLFIPNHASVYTTGHTRSGRLFGQIQYVHGESFNVTTIGFITSARGLQVVPIGPTALSEDGRVLGLTDTDDDMRGDPYDNSEHGWIWSSGHLTDLGLAIDLRFAHDGSIEGFYRTDKNGHALNKRWWILDDVLRYRAFTWRKGHREESKVLLSSKPWESPDGIPVP